MLLEASGSLQSFQPALSGSKHHQQAYHTTLMKPATPRKPLACIINGKTVAFIPTSHGIILIDSHFHGTSGAFVVIAPLDAAYELLAWFKRINSILKDQSQMFHFNHICQVN